jgi:hypothetical protein
MKNSLRVSGNHVLGLIVVLLIAVTILLALDMNRKNRTVGEKIDAAIHELTD